MSEDHEGLSADQFYVLPSGRWFGYLLLAVIGSSAGGLLITLFRSFWLAMTQGAYAATEASLIGGTISLVVLPVYALISVVVGLNMAKGHAISVHGVELVKDGVLVERVRRIASQAGLSVAPEVGIYKSPDMNAFATGSSRRNSLIAFSSSLLDKCPEEEVDAVAAHEVGHIASNDMLALSVVTSVQNAMSWYMMLRGLRVLVRRLVFFITEIGASVLSHGREYRADAISAALLGKEKMIAVLRRLETDQAHPPATQYGYARLKIRDNMFGTHPSIANRIAALEAGTYAHAVPLARRPVSTVSGEPSMG